VLKTVMRSAVTWVVQGAIAMMGATRVGRFAYARMVEAVTQRTQQVDHRGVHLCFATPNGQNQFRADTFSDKEPETLEWIDTIPEGAILWDIGANVGIYSCYAAKSRGCRVFAFEPSVFNLECLARNAFLNGLTDRLTIVPLALSDTLQVATLNMTSTEWGGALSTFGQAYGHDGKPLATSFKFATVGLSMDQAVSALKLPLPQFIKMDVDGIEHLILSGGASVLRHAESVLIEINDNFQEQADASARVLTDAGFELIDKRRWETTSDSLSQATFNQVWRRRKGERHAVERTAE
jgi:FkbM family methyltransferase